MIRVPVDLTNPGQYFACCGLFELAHRALSAPTARFEESEFVIDAPSGTLESLVASVQSAPLVELDANNATASPLHLAGAFDLRLDWWRDRSLKPWAGTMRVGRIARAMQSRLVESLGSSALFDHGMVVLGDDGKKVEPFYFDARRGANALSLDVGFSTDGLGMETTAFPATEFFSLVGLQRFRPHVLKPRIFRYHAWSVPYPPALASLAACGRLDFDSRAFRFENAFRTDQRKHKAFSPAARTEWSQE